jgi:hypothetical protein
MRGAGFGRLGCDWLIRGGDVGERIGIDEFLCLLDLEIQAGMHAVGHASVGPVGSESGLGCDALSGDVVGVHCSSYGSSILVSFALNRYTIVSDVFSWDRAYRVCFFGTGTAGAIHWFLTEKGVI